MTAEGESRSAIADAPWSDDLHEGVVRIEGQRVRALNRAAAELLRVDRDRAVGRPLIAVLRDHRLERAWLERRVVTAELRGRLLEATPAAGALLLRDVSETQRAKADARELLAVLSHELRTPVAAIRSALEALAVDPPEALRTRFLDTAQREAERLVRLLADLTVESRPPAARRVPLREMVDRARALLEPTLERSGTRLELEIPPLTVWADPDKLLQVVLNLLENAAVHGPEGSVVRLVATPEPEAARVRLAVIDRGEPIPAERLAELFKPHSRGDRVRSAGAGMGLYIVRSIAERWGGRAWAEPGGAEAERGNTFLVTVPLPPRQ